MDFRGNTIMEHDTSIAYNDVEFLSNNEKKEQSFVDLLEELKEVLGDNVEIVVIKEGR